MTDANPLAAEMLEASAAGYASAASVLLREAADEHSDIRSAPGEWKAHLTQRILELAAAVRVDDPRLFARRIRWLRRAVLARGADESSLRLALQSLRSALDRELPDAIKASVVPAIELALEELDAEVEPQTSALDASTAEGSLGIQYLAACLEGRNSAAIGLILDALENGMTPEHMYTRVLLPCEKEIGQLWHLGEVSIGEERLVSETTRQCMALIVNRYAPEADDSLTVLAAAVSGNAHDIGLRAASDLFRLAGWRSIYLGPDMPAAEIARAVKSYGVGLVLLSATLTTQLSSLAAAIDRIRQLGSDTRILVGGQAFEESPTIWKRLGADGFAPDIDSVVDIGAGLIQSR